MLFDVILFILMHTSLVHFSPGSAEADIGWGGKLVFDGQLCQKYLYQKLLKLVDIFWVTIDNVPDVFSEHGVHCI